MLVLLSIHPLRKVRIVTIPDRYIPTGESTGGGMGDIIRCTDNHLNRPVILKMLKDGEEHRRLLDEQKALIKVRSKHVVQLYDVIKVTTASGEKTALVLEHINGSDLAPNSFSPDDAYLKTVWQIACGLAEIHNEGVIHRDIKTNNIRVDVDDVVKILDFGLARSEGLDAQTVSIIGTPGYMAPELWEDPTISFDRAIDVYAFGVTALALINASIPSELLQRPPAPLKNGGVAAILAGVPGDVIEVIEKSLSYTPANRPCMAEIEETIRHHLIRDRHRALLVLGQKTHEISNSSPQATVNVGTLGSIGISYDGICFTISSLSGDVSVNNKSAAIGDKLPACCVITFGSGSIRRFVTFDVSNPEVTP